MGGAVLTLAGREYPLLFNGAALFAAQELTDRSLVEALTEHSREGFETLCKMVALLSEQAELCRRYEGYAPAEPLTAERLLRTAMPYASYKKMWVVSAYIQKNSGNSYASAADAEAPSSTSETSLPSPVSAESSIAREGADDNRRPAGFVP